MLQRVKEHFAILLTFIKLPVVIEAFVLSIYDWQFYTGFTVRCFVTGYNDVVAINTDVMVLTKT